MEIELKGAYYHGTTNRFYEFNKGFEGIFTLEGEISLSVLIELAAIKAEDKVVVGKDDPVILIIPQGVVESKTRTNPYGHTSIPFLAPEEYFPFQPRVITKLYEGDAITRLEKFLSSRPPDDIPRAFWPSNRTY